VRDFQVPGRSVAIATGGMVCTSHPLATLTAVDVLRGGGNAVDAAIAACAVQCVVEPQSTGVGGDCFVLYAPAGGGAPIALNGSGRAPRALTPEIVHNPVNGRIPLPTAHAVTVPGAVDAWFRLAEDHGTRGIDSLLRPAIGYAREGYPVMERVAYDWARFSDKLARYPETARVFLPEGKPLPPGALHRQPALAETLETIARDGRDGFYTGWVAEDIVESLDALGGVMTVNDLAEHRSEYVSPIRTSYRGYDVYQCPPNGHGVTVLLGLNILAGYDLAGLDPLGPRRFHLEAEAMRLAYQDRNTYLADPSHASVPVEALLSVAHAESLGAAIDPERAMTGLPAPSLPPHTDTVYLCVVDRDGNAVSFINSLFESFGTGIVAPRSGVLLHNRGTGFVLEPGHPNRLAPGKRPLSTLIPGMVMKDGRAVMPYGVMGGQYQAVGHVRFLTNVLDFGMTIQAALDLPRGFHFDGVYALERGVPQATCDGLARLGHRVERSPIPLGGGQAIVIDHDTGVLLGASDGRKDGIALGF
jgi:gamma-glutamyltranspeptidase/glutathione hydrolase